MRRLAPALIILALAAPSAAQASSHQLRIFQDDRMLIYSGPLVREAVLDEAKQMGVDVIRVQFVWRNIALSKPKNPADPASYGTNWSNWDSLVIDARKRGLKVLATITGPAPAWAAGMSGQYYQGSRYPNAKAFGQFVQAVGRRYSGSAKVTATASQSALIGGVLQCTPVPPLVSCDQNGNPVISPPTGPSPSPSPSPSPPPPPPGSGDQSPPPPPGSGTPTPPEPAGTPLPRIDMWSIYNEPNHPLFVSPQRAHGILVSPSIYRNLYRAGWNALARTGHRHDTILIGEVLPIGSNANRATGTTSPLTFTRELFCLNGTGKRHPGCTGRMAPLHASGFALHAYYRKTGPFSKPPGPNDVTPSSIGKLHALVVQARRRGRLSGGADLWDTEDGSQTRPPDPKGATPSQQAAYINEAEFLTWRTPYIRSFSQYLLTDEDPVWAFQSGLIYSNGQPKPALDSYRVAIYVQKAGRGVLVWGHIPMSVGNHQVTIHPSRGNDVKVLVTNKEGYFTKRLPTRAPSYSLVYGFWSSRDASPR